LKGVLLAGGQGTRLQGMTRGGNKHLLPVGGAPMITHGLEKLARAGIEEVLLVTGSHHLADFETFLSSTPFPDLRIELVAQERPGGIGEGLALCRRPLGDGEEPVVLLLGDNLFEQPLAPLLRDWRRGGAPARIHLIPVKDPERFGIATLEDGALVRLTEKPPRPESCLAVVGLYFLPASAAEIARQAPPSARGEVEIITILQHYLRRGELDHARLEGWWVDAGTPASLAEAEARIRGNSPDAPS